MVSPFITGPLVPVGMLNLIRASLGILPDSTFPENALASFWGSSPNVCLPPNSSGKQDILQPQLRAKARSRCAPARCAGARAERPGASGEYIIVVAVESPCPENRGVASLKQEGALHERY